MKITLEKIWSFDKDELLKKLHLKSSKNSINKLKIDLALKYLEKDSNSQVSEAATISLDRLSKAEA